MNLLGVDLGTRKFAFAILDHDLNLVDLTVGDRPASPNHLHVVQWFSQQALQHSHGVEQAFVELPLSGRGGTKVTMQMAMNVGALSSTLLNCGIPVQGANVQSWKREVVGRGNAGKPEVTQWLGDHHPALYAECERLTKKHRQDAVDAICVALYGHGVLARGESMGAASELLGGAA